MLGVAVAAAVANAIAFAASADIAGGAPTSRLGASLQDAAAKRNSTSAAEKRKLDMREQAVKASEARLAGQIRQQQEQQAAAAKSGQGAGAAGGPSVPYDNLARIYQTMKPNRAGPIFEKLDIDVQREVATRMRERATAQIMANMSPQGAVALSMALAGRKVVPAAAKAGK
ncbi:MotE family protein [Novosphingobium guangzhouense]|uniref:Magnesium transporter n=1 Tax=Novosphingobium guangzhouense TaxID=1850347 RepID=A0A2K2FSV4_9SPHN|nr:magnesium transporter [Novosphingobium guangzhouense]PNU01869.1 magnesium transporter [Novosphingobium guangzhouense]